MYIKWYTTCDYFTIAQSLTFLLHCTNFVNTFCWCRKPWQFTALISIFFCFLAVGSAGNILRLNFYMFYPASTDCFLGWTWEEKHSYKRRGIFQVYKCTKTCKNTCIGYLKALTLKFLEPKMPEYAQKLFMYHFAPKTIEHARVNRDN